MKQSALLFSITLALLLPLAGAAQPIGPASPLDPAMPRPFFGFLPGISWVYHSASFRALPGVPSCCPEYDFGTGVGIHFALIAGFPLLPDIFGEARVGYVSLGAELLREEMVPVEHDGEVVETPIEHRLEGALGAATAEFRAVYSMGIGWSIAAGMRGGIRTGGSFTQIEQISPDQDWGAFADGRRIRNEYSGEIPGFYAFDLAFVLSVTREFPLNSSGTFYARPELTLALGLTPIATDVSWTPHAAQVGIGFFYRPP